MAVLKILARSVKFAEKGKESGTGRMPVLIIRHADERGFSAYQFQPPLNKKNKIVVGVGTVTAGVKGEHSGKGLTRELFEQHLTPVFSELARRAGKNVVHQPVVAKNNERMKFFLKKQGYSEAGVIEGALRFSKTYRPAGSKLPLEREEEKIVKWFLSKRFKRWTPEEEHPIGIGATG
jgi:hypothetical protein